MLPCILHEDQDLLVANKPAGLNTHAPDPYAGAGLYEFLKHREPRWANLAIIHRLDKETSGVLVFAKTATANSSLTEQFTKRLVRKIYYLLTTRPVTTPLHLRSAIVRVGSKYASRPPHAGAPIAETRFTPLSSSVGTLLRAEPLTGRTHQIRVQAADHGFPILGDRMYGGAPAPRLCLHAGEITFRHPTSGQEMTFSAPYDFAADVRHTLRTALIEEHTDAFRLLHGASDQVPDWYVEKLGNYLLSQSKRPLKDDQLKTLADLAQRYGARGAYHKILSRSVRGAAPEEASPIPVWGKPAPNPFEIRENGVSYSVSFGEGYSVGLFLDQRENRRRLLTGHVAAGFHVDLDSSRKVLNTFAYTCGFSVCAARGGARTTSLDLSRKYLEWGKRNFQLSQLDLAGHDFIFGDTFDWLRRLGKKGRVFEVVMLDPPTFSQSRESGVFRVERDYPKLLEAALAVLRPGGVLFASSNAAIWAPERFCATVNGAVAARKRKVVQQHFETQPPDFPLSREEPAYLKTLWLRVE